MPAIHDTLFRQWLMIRTIPREPRTISTQGIFDRLRSEGYVVTDRTVARDLDSLSTVFGYTCEEHGRAKHWFWPSHTRVLDIPGMEPTAAMAWMMSHDYLGKSLPAGAIEHLQPYFSRAKEVLESQRGRRQSKWKSIFRVARRGPILDPPAMSGKIYEGICEVLLESRQLKIRYRSRDSAKSKEHVLHPLALVLRHQIYYLVATAWDYTSPVHYALHRMEHAEILNESAKSLPGFDLDSYVETSFQYPASPSKLALRLKVQSAVASHLAERPLGKDQSLKALKDGWHAVKVTVLDSSELRWWILGFGDQIIVEAPKSLRLEFKSTVSRLAGEYGV
ncbi:MAG: helix-turn-helix transcriptional regulator [Oceanococcus sp.]